MFLYCLVTPICFSRNYLVSRTLIFLERNYSCFGRVIIFLEVFISRFMCSLTSSSLIISNYTSSELLLTNAISSLNYRISLFHSYHISLLISLSFLLYIYNYMYIHIYIHKISFYSFIFLRLYNAYLPSKSYLFSFSLILF